MLWQCPVRVRSSCVIACRCRLHFRNNLQPGYSCLPAAWRLAVCSLVPTQPQCVSDCTAFLAHHSTASQEMALTPCTVTVEASHPCMLQQHPNMVKCHRYLLMSSRNDTSVTYQRMNVYYCTRPTLVSITALVVLSPTQMYTWLICNKPSCRWQTRATRKHAKNCSNSTCLQRCRWHTGLYSFAYLLVRPKSAKSREILWKFKLI